MIWKIEIWSEESIDGHQIVPNQPVVFPTQFNFNNSCLKLLQISLQIHDYPLLNCCLQGDIQIKPLPLTWSRLLAEIWKVGVQNVLNF